MKERITPRNVLGFFIVAVVFSLALMIVWNFRGSSPEKILEALPANIDLSLKKIDYTETRDGVSRWNLMADSAERNVNSGVTRIQNVFMTFYDENGLDVGTLSAQTGVIPSDRKNISIYDDVVVRSVRGYTFYSDHLDYSESTRQLTTDVPVRITSERMEITGKGFSLDVDRQFYRLLADVKVQLYGGTKQ
jgi:lipopolysaccharide export system protein LptC